MRRCRDMRQFTSELRMLDLPTFGRPMMATARALSEDSTASGFLGGGSNAMSCSMRSPVPVPLMADTAIGSKPSCQKSATCKQHTTAHDPVTLKLSLCH